VFFAYTVSRILGACKTRLQLIDKRDGFLGTQYRNVVIAVISLDVIGC